MAEPKLLVNQLGETTKLALSIAEDGKIEYEEVCKLLGSIVKSAARLLEVLENRNDRFEELVEACETIFDESIAPLDVRAIPNFLEPAVDRTIRRRIRPMIAELYELLDGGNLAT